MTNEQILGNSSQEGNSTDAHHNVKKSLNLYEILDVSKNATDDEIKRAYRKLALKYHPDKNLEGDPQKTERFKEINHANAILSNPTRRKIYDEYGEMGLKLIEQFGDENTVLRLAFKPWFKWTVVICGLSTCGFFCCCFGCMFCCNCCCNFCCGKYKPKGFDEDDEIFVDPANENGDATVITSQPEESTAFSQKAQFTTF